MDDMKVIVVDDEKAMLLVMKKMLAKIPGIEIAGLFQHGEEAFNFIRNNRVDLAFIDINMPEESGLELAKRMLAVSAGLDVVFSTSHREYAVDAFELFAFDYIVKPVSQARLERTAKKALEKKSPVLDKDEKLNRKKLAVYCFGRMDVSSELNGMVKWRSAKSEELFAYLLLNMGRSVSRERILEDVFRDLPLKNAETYLNTTVYQIRKSLEPHELKTIIITTHESLRLDLKEVYLDFAELENRVKAMENLDETNLQSAIETEKLYADDLFGDKTYWWAIQERERLAVLYAGFAKKLGSYLLKNNQLESALEILKRLINRNEFDEEANSLMIKLYAGQRDKTALVQHYERYVKILQRELGMKPGRDIMNLFAELRIDPL